MRGALKKGPDPRAALRACALGSGIEAWNVDNPASLFLELLFSAAGAGYFIYGKKQRATVPFVCGLVLMVYPYFVSSTLLLVIIGIVLMTLPYFVRL